MAQGGKVEYRMTNPSREPQHVFDVDPIPARMCASDIALLFISGMGAGFLIALLTLGEVVVK
jgi:hypothetical protein